MSLLSFFLRMISSLKVFFIDQDIPCSPRSSAYTCLQFPSTLCP